MPYINYYDSGFSFLTHGNAFPNNNASISEFSLAFNAPVTISIDFGNGVVTDYAAILSGGFYYVSLAFSSGGAVPVYSYPSYVYPDALDVDRRITINIQDTDKVKLTGILLRGLTNMPSQFFSISFNTYPNLASLVLSLLNNNILGLDASFLTLPHFTIYNIGNNVTSPSSNFYGIIPAVVLAKSTMISFSFGDAGIRLKSFADSNLDKIATSFPAIQIFGVSQLGTTDNHMGDGALPANFSTITTLIAISIHGSAWTTIPAILNTMSNYANLGVTYSSTLISWGDLSSAAARLISLSVDGCGNLTTTLPAWFANMTLLKTFSWRTIGKSGGGSANIDTFIINWYVFITGHAAISGANTLPFRGISLNIAGDPSPANAAIPGGTYQQPTGYIQGISNGTPASSLERLWVLANQYGHTNIYRAV